MAIFHSFELFFQNIFVLYELSYTVCTRVAIFTFLDLATLVCTYSRVGQFTYVEWEIQIVSFPTSSRSKIKKPNAWFVSHFISCYILLRYQNNFFYNCILWKYFFDMNTNSFSIFNQKVCLKKTLAYTQVDTT